jgi:dCTP deaminase
MISPFENKQVRDNKISYGLSSFGYDARVSNEFKIFTNINSEIVDPKILSKITLFLKKETNVLFHQILLFYQVQSNI